MRHRGGHAGILANPDGRCHVRPRAAAVVSSHGERIPGERAGRTGPAHPFRHLVPAFLACYHASDARTEPLTASDGIGPQPSGPASPRDDGGSGDVWQNFRWFAASGALAVLLGFLPPVGVRKRLFLQWGLPCLALALVTWLITIIPGRAAASHLRRRGRRQAPLIGLAVLLGAAAFLISPPTIQILADQTNLLAMSQGMFEEGTPQKPVEMIRLENGRPFVLTWREDKRPLLFPFLVCLAHGLTGYRPANLFLVNGLAWVLTLALFGLLLRRAFGLALAATGMILLGALPLAILAATSGGFETVNLLFLVLAGFWWREYVTRPTARTLETLSLTLALLAQVRYESPVFSLVLLPLAWAWLPREEWREIGWRSFLLPHLFLPVAWQGPTTFDPGLHQMPPGAAVFSFANLRHNLGAAGEFLLARRASFGTVGFLFPAGVAGALGAGIAAFRQGPAPARRFWTGLGLSLGTFTLILLSFFHAELTFPTVHRLGLPFFPFLAAGTVWLLQAGTRCFRPGRRLLPLAAAFLLVWYSPVSQANHPCRQMAAFRQFQSVTTFLAASFPDRNVVLVGDAAYAYVPLGWSALRYPAFRALRPHLIRAREAGLFRDILFIQEFDLASGRPSPENDPGSGAVLRTLFEDRFTDERGLRISCLVP